MNTKTPRKARSKTSTTLALEAISKRSELSVKYLRELHRAGMPLELSEALDWIDDRPDQSPTDGATVGELRKARLELLRLQTEKAEIELAARKGELISRAECNESDFKIGSAVKAGMLALENKIPALCLGLPLNRSAPLVKKAVREVLQDLHEHSPKYWRYKSMPDGKDI